MIVAEGLQISVADLELPAEVPRPVTLADHKRETILETLKRHGGNQTAAAAELGIDRSTLYRKLRQWGIEP